MIQTNKRSLTFVLALVVLLTCALSLRANAADETIAVADYLTFPTAGTGSKVTPSTDYTSCTITLDAEEEPITQTFTFTNKTDVKIKVGFTYTFSYDTGTGTKTFSQNMTDSSGSVSVTLKGGETFSVTMELDPGGDYSTGTFKMTGISVTLITEAAVTVNYDSMLGKVNGYADTDPITIPEAGITLTAVPAEGARFLGWTDQDGAVLADTATAKIEGSADLSEIHAVFVGDTPWFLVPDADCNYLIEGLTAAEKKAQSTSKNTLILMNDAILPSGDYTITSGVTLLIPHDATNTVIGATPPRSIETYAAPTPFRKLTMESGAKITVNGAISIGGIQSAAMGYNGANVGGFGVIEMAGDSNITIESGGTLYAWGYIARVDAGDEGTVIAKSGATVYESFQITDWRGGTATTSMIGTTEASHAVHTGKYTFPISQLYFQNVQVPITIHAGAVEHVAVSYELDDTQETSSIILIGRSTDTCLFKLSGTGAAITKNYEEETDRVNFNVSGAVTMGQITISVAGFDLETSKYYLGLNGNMTIHLEDGCAVTITQDFAFLPGMILDIKKGASMTISEGYEIVVYDASEWGGYCGAGNATFVPIRYVYHGDQDQVKTTPGRSSQITDAKIIVGGTINATAGRLYTTTSGAAIVGTNDSPGKVNLKFSKVILTYKVMGFSRSEEIKAYQVTQNDRSVDYTEKTVNSTVLTNETGKSPATVTLNSEGTTYNYTYTHGVWGTHTATTGTTTAGTCTGTGTVTYSCSCGTTYTGTTPALGHDMQPTSTVVAPTCTTPGYTVYKCSRCDVTENWDYTAKLGHGWGSWEVVTPATCEGTGTRTRDCTRCDAVDTWEDAAIGHAWGEPTYTWSEDNSTCTATRVCGNDNSHKETETVNSVKTGTEPTCVADGSATYTATFTNTTFTQQVKENVVLPANGIHAWGDWSTGVCANEDCNAHAIETSGIYLTITSEILLNLKFSIHDDLLAEMTEGTALKATVKEEYNHISGEFNETYTVPNEKIYMVSQGIAAGEMTGVVTVSFKLGNDDATAVAVPVFDIYLNEDGTMVDAVTKTVQDYAKLAFKAAAGVAEADKENSVYDELKTMCEWALTFGGYAQTYFGTHTDKLAYNMLDSVPSLAVTSWGNHSTTVVSPKEYTGPIAVGQKLNLDSNIYMRIYFSNADATGCAITLYKPDQNGQNTAEIPLEFRTETGSNRRYLDIADIPPAYWNDEFRIDITKDGQTYSITTSPLAWCYLCVNSDAKQEQKDMAMAMYHYSYAADAYFVEKARLESAE